MDAPHDTHQNWSQAFGFPDGVASLTDYAAYLHQVRGLGDSVFRGEHRYYETCVRPSIYRNGEIWKPISATSNLSRSEYWQIRRCQLARLLNLRTFGFNGPEWVGIAQHYGRKTRLVDVTFNHEFALFFACWDIGYPPADETEDGWVYIFAQNTFRPMSILRQDVESRSIEQGISTDFRDLFNASTASRLIDNVGHLYTPRADRMFNRRMAAQAGAFLWWHPPDQKFPHQLICIKVNRNAKGSILKELDAKGISIDVLFPDKLGKQQLRLAQ